MPEYSVIDAVHFLSSNPKSPMPGWCYASKRYIAECLGLSKSFVFESINKAIELNLIEKSIDGKYLRATETWFNELSDNGQKAVSAKRTAIQMLDTPGVHHPDSDYPPSGLEVSTIRPPSNSNKKDTSKLTANSLGLSSSPPPPSTPAATPNTGLPPIQDRHRIWFEREILDQVTLNPEEWQIRDDDWLQWCWEKLGEKDITREEMLRQARKMVEKRVETYEWP